MYLGVFMPKIVASATFLHFSSSPICMLNATHEFAGRTAASPSSLAAVEAEVEAADQALFEDGCVFGIPGIRIGRISVTGVGKIDFDSYVLRLYI